MGDLEKAMGSSVTVIPCICHADLPALSVAVLYQ